MIQLLAGDCRSVLPTLAADSVHCVVCSPPYYGLRDYGTALWDGGDPDCSHTTSANRDSRPRNGLTGGTATIEAATIQRGDCRCGAVRIDRQIGLEATPDEYLATMVAVFREVRRVLRPDGTCWVNMGDSYASNGTSGLHTKSATSTLGPNGDGLPGNQNWSVPTPGAKSVPVGLKPKDLLLMPARLALALQADGWWVRSDIIIAKKNPMPESCRDRPTSAHEHVFLLTKSARYFFDGDAVREKAEATRIREETTWDDRKARGELIRRGDPGQTGHIARTATLACNGSRNLRNVWDISTEAFGGAHFATMPTSVVERCIRAGTSERGCCAACGKPWVRVVERGAALVMRSENDGNGYVLPKAKGADSSTRYRDGSGFVPNARYETTTTGWDPGCRCRSGACDAPYEVVPCRVLDPFAGAGTTLLVADRLQRDAIGIELNVAYTEMAMERCRADAPLFTSFPPAEDPEDSRMADLFAGDEYQQMPAAVPKPQRVPTGWDTGPGAHGTIHRNGRTMPEAAE